MTDSSLTPTLQDFRKIITEEFTSKGISPPLPDSPREAELYYQWLIGWKKLNQLNAAG